MLVFVTFPFSSTTLNTSAGIMIMTSPTHVLLFPHEHTDILGALHELNIRSKTRPQLRAFLASSSAVVHEQAAASNGRERESIGPFDDLVELAERHFNRKNHSVVAETVLLTTVQISQLLMYVKTSAKRNE